MKFIDCIALSILRFKQIDIHVSTTNKFQGLTIDLSNVSGRCLPLHVFCGRLTSLGNGRNLLVRVF